MVRISFHREQNRDRKPEPQTLEEITDLDIDFKETKSGQPFLLKEVSEGKKDFPEWSNGEDFCRKREALNIWNEEEHWLSM